MGSEEKFWVCVWALLCIMVVSIAAFLVINADRQRQFVIKMAEQGYIQSTKRNPSNDLFETTWIKEEK